MSRRTWKPEHGVQGALEMLDGFAKTEQDYIPTLDQDIPVASHPDWDKASTLIVACRIGNDLYKDKRRYESRDEALAAITKEFGKPVECNYVPGRAFFRVRKRK